MAKLVRLDKVCFAYKKHQVISGLSLEIAHGGITALLGANGSGKTTLLKLILGLHRAEKGAVLIEGEEIGRFSRKKLARIMAYVPQSHREAFAYRIIDVVLMGRMPHLSFFGRSSSLDMQAAENALEQVGIAHLAGRPYTEVSGGERQLALIARALVQNARLFVLDEPTNGLDYGNQIRLLEHLKQLARSAGTSFIFTTHHPDHALAIADRIVMMNDGAIVGDDLAGNITDQHIRKLYGVTVQLVKVSSHTSVCVPVFQTEKTFREVQ